MSTDWNPDEGGEDLITMLIHFSESAPVITMHSQLLRFMSSCNIYSMWTSVALGFTPQARSCLTLSQEVLGTVYNGCIKESCIPCSKTAPHWFLWSWSLGYCVGLLYCAGHWVTVIERFCVSLKGCTCEVLRYIDAMFTFRLKTWCKRRLNGAAHGHLDYTTWAGWRHFVFVLCSFF